MYYIFTNEILKNIFILQYMQPELSGLFKTKVSESAKLQQHSKEGFNHTISKDKTNKKY